MKHPDFDKAFAPTPEIVHLSIEAAFRKGEKAMKLRHKITAMLSAAAVLAMACGVFALALPSEPRPDVVSQPHLSETFAGEEPTVYYTPKGNYYHFIEDCSGMMGAVSHGLTEAREDGKRACPVCVSDAEAYGGSITMDENGEIAEVESHPMPTEAPTRLPVDESFVDRGTEMIFISYGDDRSATEVGADIFQSVFGVNMHDALKGYVLTFTDAYDMVAADGVMTEEIQFRFSEDGFSDDGAEFTPVIVTVESRDEKILSGSIFLNFVNFSGKDFREQCSTWYQNVCECAADSMAGMGMLGTGSGNMSEVPLNMLVHFDSALKPSVCTLEYESNSGYITLSFDVVDNGASLASMNYSVSKA